MKVVTDSKRIDDILKRGVEEIFVSDHLRWALLSGRTLKIKLGFDPTGPNIHLGRAIILRKLRDFQRLGHKIIFIVGDFTALIGDPSDKLGKRPMLKEAEISNNLKNYKRQVGKIIDLKKAEFKLNSRWLKKLNFKEIGELAESFSVQQMLARRNFKERWTHGEEISLREFLYPLMQGYDSVAVKADVEIGGSDQLFNLKAGRIVQRHYNQKEQDILTTQMLEGLDGRKMSTSWNNVVNIFDPPDDMFGKTMSIHDDLTFKYFNLCTDLTDEEIKKIVQQNPRDAKLRLSFEIVKLYHGETAAEKSQAEFIKVFSRKEKPSEIPERKWSSLKIEKGKTAESIAGLLYLTGRASSKSDAWRLINQGAVRVNGEKIADPHKLISVGEETLIQVGKKIFLKVI